MASRRASPHARQRLLRTSRRDGLPLGVHLRELTFFVTTIEFRPTLRKQRDDAAAKGQLGRTRIFDGLLDRLEHDAS